LEPLIRVRNLRYRYPDGTQALNGVDFDLYPGESVALLGGNGSGKTTFLLHLNGLLHGDGEVVISGFPVRKENFREIRRRIGFVFQDADDQLFMPTVRDDVAFGLINSGLEAGAASRRAGELLTQMGMSESAAKAPFHLSGGEKRRVALAGVLALQPEVLVLDEPTTSLDPPAQRDLVEVLNRLNLSKVMTTHDVGFARAVATRAVFFDKGRIVSVGTVDEVAGNHRWQL